MKFQFEAMDRTGQEIKDVIEAPSSEEAQSTIRQMGYFVTRIVEANSFEPVALDKNFDDQILIAAIKKVLIDKSEVIAEILVGELRQIREKPVKTPFNNLKKYFGLGS